MRHRYFSEKGFAVDEILMIKIKTRETLFIKFICRL